MNKELLFWRSSGNRKSHIGIKAINNGKDVLLSLVPEVDFFTFSEDSKTIRLAKPEDIIPFFSKPVVDSPFGQGKSKHNVQRQRLHAEIAKLTQELNELKLNKSKDYIVIPALEWEAFAYAVQPLHQFDPKAWAAGFAYLYEKFSKKSTKETTVNPHVELHNKLKRYVDGRFSISTKDMIDFTERYWKDVK